ncbi:MAG: DUF4174 domain-containing protein [Thalassovita sp.]
MFGIIASLALTGPALATDATEPVEFPLTITEELTLEPFLWTSRPIVVFADNAADPRFEEQMRFLEADLEALAVRDSVVLVDTDPALRSALRKKLRPRGFMLVLIDKDGQVKLRKPAPWTTREISRSIDKWPSRQQEIRVELGKE